MLHKERALSRYKDDRNMRRKHIAVTERALEMVIGALRNIDVEHYDKATKQLHMALDHLDSIRAINNQTWKRFRKAKREKNNLAKSYAKFKKYKRTFIIIDDPTGLQTLFE